MKKIGIIVDSCSSLGEDFLRDHNIGIVRFKYSLDGKSYREGLDQTTEAYHLALEESDDFPKTSQPSLGDYLQIFEEYSQAYEDVIVLPLSRGLSGSYQAAKLASENFDNIRLVDTLQVLDTIRFMVERTLDLIEKGLGAGDIVEILERDKAYPNYGILLVANELQYLEKGGRIPPAIGKLGDFLQLKAILDINTKGDGKLGLKEMSRGTKKTVNSLVQLLPEDVKRVAIGHVNNPQVKEDLQERVRKRFPMLSLQILQLPL